MSDTKLDTRSLSAEEEAILDACFRGNIHDLGSAIVCYGRALFGQGESEAKATRDLNRLPEPAATEMPEAVRKVCHRLRHLAMTSAIACRIGDRDEFDEYAYALECWWRNHAAQPVKAPRPKLEKVREFINGVSHAWLNSEGKAKKLQALAELDAYESGGKGVEG